MVDFKIQSEFSKLEYSFPHSARSLLTAIFIFTLANSNLLFIKTKLIFLKLVFLSQLLIHFVIDKDQKTDISFNHAWTQFFYCFESDYFPSPQN